MPSTHIDHVIRRLEFVIQWSIKHKSRIGYFAALYERVTIEVDKMIDDEYFNDNDLMMQFDVIFAEHYLSAFETYMRGDEPAAVWKLAFDKADDPKLVVLQHLLLGMNAHINLDLAVTVSNFHTKETIQGFKEDFYRINDVLSSLVDEIQEQIGVIYKPMRYIDFLLGRLDEYIVDKLMGQFRDRAWKLAEELVSLHGYDRAAKIQQVDREMAELAEKSIARPLRRLLAPIGFILRKGEQAHIDEIIEKLHLGNTYEKWEDWAV
ncbi:MAG: hypothetical protein INQ03_10030 [Candidatus Heimdallarchaeota archaeon]|nr:hypothetical protein [Candidatus Heimdallarchaeota archaeon]